VSQSETASQGETALFEFPVHFEFDILISHRKFIKVAEDDVFVSPHLTNFHLPVSALTHL
jgi:hypothetical protein